MWLHLWSAKVFFFKISLGIITEWASFGPLAQSMLASSLVL